MHYFKRNIGEYHKKAGKLNMLQHGAYTLLMDACYDREMFPTLDEAIDWCWASSSEEIAAVEFVLRKFFTLIDCVYVQNRISEEIQQYHDKALINKEIAINREKAKRDKKARTVVEPYTNEHESAPKQEPRTKHQETENNKKDKATGKPLVTFSRWLEIIKELGEKPVPDDNPIFQYADDAGIDSDYLRLAWVEFKARYTDDNKRYKDWRAVFGKSVRGNWFKLWWHDGNGYQLTTLGQQNMTAMKNRDKRDGQ